MWVRWLRRAAGERHEARQRQGQHGYAVVGLEGVIPTAGRTWVLRHASRNPLPAGPLLPLVIESQQDALHVPHRTTPRRASNGPAHPQPHDTASEVGCVCGGEVAWGHSGMSAGPRPGRAPQGTPHTPVQVLQLHRCCS